MSAADFFTRYPSIYDDFRARLQAFGTDQSEFHIFAVLVCLSHIYPTMQNEKYPTSVFAPDILRIMFTCHGEKLRELAVAALLSTSDASTIRMLFEIVATKQFLQSATENQLKAMLNLV
ncbi:Protein Y92H12A.5 [Aphelenchoides avenae]|nr:Protein Y92H12A.5 [Aphelenchus avenae]